MGKAPVRSMPKSAARPKSGIGSMLWLQGMACGAVLTFATPAALLGGTLMAPALIALLADREPGRPVTRAVLLFGGSVSIEPLWRLCLSGDSMATALEIMSDPAMLAFAWIAAAFGWAMCEVLPVLLENGSRLAEAARVAAWKAELKRIEEEWGE
jgi:hypothetical protein